MLAWLEHRGGALDDYVFPSRSDHADHLSTRQYARLVDEWVAGIGLHCEDYGTHSLRRTKASIICKATGNLRAVQILLGHTKIERYSSLSRRGCRGRTQPRRRHRGVALQRLPRFARGKPAKAAAVRPIRLLLHSGRRLEKRTRHLGTRAAELGGKRTVRFRVVTADFAPGERTG